MRYILKHSRVYSGKKTPTFHVLLLIQGNLWAGELWDFLLHAQEKHYVKECCFFFFFLWKQFSRLCMLEAPPLLLSLHEETEQVAWLADQH